MARYSVLKNSFEQANIKLAQTWRKESQGWNDEKGKQFGERVLTPISNECRDIVALLNQMDQALNTLADNKMIDEK